MLNGNRRWLKKQINFFHNSIHIYLVSLRSKLSLEPVGISAPCLRLMCCFRWNLCSNAAEQNGHFSIFVFSVCRRSCTLKTKRKWYKYVWWWWCFAQIEKKKTFVSPAMVRSQKSHVTKWASVWSISSRLKRTKRKIERVRERCKSSYQKMEFYLKTLWFSYDMNFHMVFQTSLPFKSLRTMVTFVWHFVEMRL